MVRAIGLDVHLEFCEVAIAEGGRVRSAGKITTKPEQRALFAASLGAQDRVALEVTGNAWQIARALQAHVEQVIVGLAQRYSGQCRRHREAKRLKRVDAVDVA